MNRTAWLPRYGSLYEASLQNNFEQVAAPLRAQTPPPREPMFTHREVIGGAVIVDEGLEVVEEGNVNDPTQTEDLQPEIVEGKVLRPQEEHRRPVFLALLALFFVLIGSTLLLTFLLRPSSSNSNSSEKSNAINERKNDSWIALQVYTPFTNNDSIPPAVAAAIQDPASDLHRANIWMLNDPMLNAYPRDRQWRRFHMVSFYYITHGEHWFRNDHWLSYNVSECEWYSSHNVVSSSASYLDTLDSAIEDERRICAYEDDGRLLVLNVSSNNLQGTFPRMTHFIESLVHFDISHNQLGGSLPILTYQPNILSYIVSDNDFVGLFTGSYTSFLVRNIKTSGNRLFGVTPQLFPMMPELDSFDNSNNLYEGVITSLMGNCTKMEQLSLAYNLYFGTIPSELGMVTNLQVFNITGNLRVHSSIPTEFAALTQLAKLDISNTSMSGEIPEVLCERFRKGTLVISANCSRVQCCHS